jgi:hypothetical protein
MDEGVEAESGPWYKVDQKSEILLGWGEEAVA